MKIVKIYQNAFSKCKINVKAKMEFQILKAYLTTVYRLCCRLFRKWQLYKPHGKNKFNFVIQRVEREHLFSPLKDASEDIALSVSFFQSLEEPQLENAFEAEKNTWMSKQYPENMMCQVESRKTVPFLSRKTVPFLCCFGSFAISLHLKQLLHLGAASN